MSGQVTVDLFAVVVARPGHEDEVRQACASITDACRAEEGVLEFRFLADLADPRAFAWFERWTSEEHFAAHGRSAHVTALHAALEGKLDGPAQVHRYDAPGGRPGA